MSFRTAWAAVPAFSKLLMRAWLKNKQTDPEEEVQKPSWRHGEEGTSAPKLRSVRQS